MSVIASATKAEVKAKDEKKETKKAEEGQKKT